MRKNLVIVAVCLAALSLVVSVRADGLKSGPQVGKAVPGPFHPLNCTGESAGEKVCLFCKNGQNPVAMIFARRNSPSLTKLIKKIDEVTAKYKDANMGSFVVFLSDNEKLEGELKELAKNENLQHCVLSIDNPAGPKGYGVNKDADVTVVLYAKRTVKANHAFKTGALTDKDIVQVVADVSKILPQK